MATGHNKDDALMANNVSTNSRLVSLDAVRGFDMFFIMGGEGLLVS